MIYLFKRKKIVKFEKQNEVANFLKCDETEVSRALSKGWNLRGYNIQKIENENFLLIGIPSGKATQSVIDEGSFEDMLKEFKEEKEDRSSELRIVKEFYK